MPAAFVGCQESSWRETKSSLLRSDIPISPFSSSRRQKLRDSTYVELGITPSSSLEGVLAGLPLFGGRGAAGPSARDLGGPEARGGAEGGAEGGATDDARHSGCN